MAQIQTNKRTSKSIDRKSPHNESSARDDQMNDSKRLLITSSNHKNINTDDFTA